MGRYLPEVDRLAQLRRQFFRKALRNVVDARTGCTRAVRHGAVDLSCADFAAVLGGGDGENDVV